MKITPIPPASIYKRLAASLFDRAIFLLALLVMFLVPAFILSVSGEDPRLLTEWARQVPGFWICLLIWMVYCVGQEAKSGATWGKKIMGCRVLGVAGERVGIFKAFRRFWTSSFNWLSLGIGFLLIVARRDHRGLHDLLAGTQVVDAVAGQAKLRMLGKVLIIGALSFAAFCVAFVLSLRGSFA